MRVLVIEDSHVVRRYVCLMLEQHADIEVLEASDGLAGLSMARHERPDVILADLMLPGMHGIDIIKAVMREQPCPIVVLSGHLRDADHAWRSVVHAQAESVYLPVAERTHPRLAQRYRHWCRTFARRLDREE